MPSGSGKRPGAQLAGHASVEPTEYDAIVVGSGLGGAMFARQLVHAGLRVLMLERGDWVPRDLLDWDAAGSLELTPFFDGDQAYRATGEVRCKEVRSCSCVGGQAVFFGGAVPRYREQDFVPDPEIVGRTGTSWPITYRDLEPHYAEAERVLDVAGPSGNGPTEPPRSVPYPQTPRPLSPVSRRIATAAADLSLVPSILPLAINYRLGARVCAACGTCDSYACALGAKNDPAARLLPDLLQRGLELRTNTVAVRFDHHAGEVTQVVCYDRPLNRWVAYRARTFALAAGALATPHLLLASALDRLNPGGHTVGRYLMRHCNAAVFGAFPRRLEGVEEFHKQLCFFDYYFGHPEVSRPSGKLGVIQQVHPPPPGLVRSMIPPPFNWLAAAAVPHMTGLVVMAEDQPQADNRVTLDLWASDRYGLPRGHVIHRYTRRDLEARRALIGRAKRILRRAGAAVCYVHPVRTFSHAVGTVRMGTDSESSALDASCRFRGLENLYVVDASALPTAGAVNPGLTIGANALRVGARLVAMLNRRSLRDQTIRNARLAGLSRLRAGHRHSQ